MHGRPECSKPNLQPENFSAYLRLCADVCHHLTRYQRPHQVYDDYVMLFIVKTERNTTNHRLTKEYYVVEQKGQRVIMREERRSVVQRMEPRVGHSFAPIDHTEKGRGHAENHHPYRLGLDVDGGLVPLRLRKWHVRLPGLRDEEQNTWRHGTTTSNFCPGGTQYICGRKKCFVWDRGYVFPPQMRNVTKTMKILPPD